MKIQLAFLGIAAFMSQVAFASALPSKPVTGGQTVISQAPAQSWTLAQKDDEKKKAPPKKLSSGKLGG